MLRSYDLDSDRTLADQLLFGAADEFGYVDWDKVSLPKRSDSNGNLLAANDIIPAAADTFGSVRAEFAQPVMGKDVVEKQKIVEAEKENTMLCPQLLLEDNPNIGVNY
jgi:hypothetical protein